MEIPDTIKLLAMFVCLLHEVASQCSEAHRQACSYPYLRLQQLTSHNDLSRYVPDYNETTLQTACNLYTDYRNCSEPFLPSCNEHTLADYQMFDATLGLVCGDLFHGYLEQKSCFQRRYPSYNSCKKKEIEAVQKLDYNSRSIGLMLCSAAREYGYCIYSATALGCSFKAADVYFNLLNHSIASLFDRKGYSCSLHHPMEVISLYPTTPIKTSTTSTRTTQFSTNDNENTYSESKEISGVRSCYNRHILLHVVLTMFSLVLYFNLDLLTFNVIVR